MNTWNTFLELVDASISLSPMEKIQFIEYIYRNKIDIKKYIEVFKAEQEQAQTLSEKFCNSYNESSQILKDKIYNPNIA